MKLNTPFHLIDQGIAFSNEKEDNIILTRLNDNQEQMVEVVKRINNWDEAIELLEIVDEELEGVTFSYLRKIKEFLAKIKE